MIKAIKRWLGFERKAPDASKLPPRRSRSATAAVLTNGPRARKTPPKPPAPPRLRSSKAEFSLDIEREEPFDPYNTGKFDRSASWERISRNQR